MRGAGRISLLVLILLGGAGGSRAAEAATGSSSEPTVVHPAWRVVVSAEFRYAGASDRYVAVVHGYTGDGQLTLIDEQSGTSQTLSPPPCGNAYGPSDQVLFGGPWLLVECAVEPGTVQAAYMLYNLDSEQWTSFRVSPQCPGACFVIGIGRYWVKVQTSGAAPPFGHEPTFYYLQNIQTGEFKRDPVTGGGRTFDDLSAPSGSGPLCDPLRYPPGLLSFYGQFAVTWEDYGETASTGYHLRRCGSQLNLMLHGTGLSPDRGVLASSAAVIVTPEGTTLDGWFLPRVWPFRLSPPETQTSCGGPPLPRVVPVALTARTIYVRPSCGTQQLWAATLPPPVPPPVRCTVPNVKRKTLTAARVAIRAAHCQIGRVTHTHSTRIRRGRVIAEKPRPGSVLANRGKVQLVLSSGKRR